ncbi:DUF551 domain-containing protein [Klebsiella michiganensis]|uniref:DUF551 domain-containing protein n=1 Tax=Klebsiella michiganensis TaxID=1134687 RepID=UPI003CED7FC6
MLQAGNSPVIPDDTLRMDWLVSKTVNVREPMVYGSHSLFWSQTISDDWSEVHATTLREQIDEAMLAVAPHDTHALNSLQSVDSVAGKWIPVSERMPDDNSDVLCTAEFDGPGDWRRKVGYWHEGEWVVYGASWTPTHWMPLPAAPQEVNHG